MNEDEKIAYEYLKKIYSKSDIVFEPNGHTKYPDFLCENSLAYEVSGLYSMNFSKTSREFETPIIKHIENLIDKYNKREFGYVLDITITGEQNPDKKSLENWFLANNNLVTMPFFTSGCLTISLIKQEAHEEKYCIYGIDNENSSGWIIPAHLDALSHVINKKEKVMSLEDTLILINHVFPNVVEKVNSSQIQTSISKIIVLSPKSELQYEWPSGSG